MQQVDVAEQVPLRLLVSGWYLAHRVKMSSDIECTNA